MGCILREKAFALSVRGGARAQMGLAAELVETDTFLFWTYFCWIEERGAVFCIAFVLFALKILTWEYLSSRFLLSPNTFHLSITIFTSNYRDFAIIIIVIILIKIMLSYCDWWFHNLHGYWISLVIAIITSRLLEKWLLTNNEFRITCYIAFELSYQERWIYHFTTFIVIFKATLFATKIVRCAIR